MKNLDEPKLFDCGVITDIAATRSITPAQVMLSWAIGRGTVVIPKSTNRHRQQENFQSATIELTKDELTVIDKIDVDHRFVDGTFWELEGGPYTLANLWG